MLLSTGLPTTFVFGRDISRT
uniref:Uncharacterized protein n=1 Tax=Musa acuminata subsp. malaccensis TaxID=214687 RepID=A0A804JAS5_MUSAM